MIMVVVVDVELLGLLVVILTEDVAECTRQGYDE